MNDHGTLTARRLHHFHAFDLPPEPRATFARPPFDWRSPALAAGIVMIMVGIALLTWSAL